MPPSCASDSTMSTPGTVGRPGKCPAKKGSSPDRCQWPRAETPGSTAVTSETKRNGGRCGRTSAGFGSTIRDDIERQERRALAAFLAGAFLALTAFLAAVFFGAAFLAGSAAFLLTVLATDFLAGALEAATAFLAGAFFSGAATLVRRPAFVGGDGGGNASSATRRGGSSPASTNGRSSPFLSICRALVGGGVPMPASGM